MVALLTLTAVLFGVALLVYAPTLWLAAELVGVAVCGWLWWTFRSWTTRPWD